MKKRYFGILAMMVVLLMTTIIMGGCGKEEKAGPTGEMTISVVCHNAAAMEKEGKLDEDVASIVPDDGILLEEKTVTFTEGDNALDATRAVLREEEMQTSSSGSGDTEFIDSIDNLSAGDVGSASGWMFLVNGEYPDVGPSKYIIQDQDVIVWEYTCTGDEM